MILHRGDYGLKGIYSLEEYYAKNLASYYEALDIGGSHNYYMGRADADVTKFIEYFIIGMADSFAKVRARAEDAGWQSSLDMSPRLRELSAQQRNALSLFLRSRFITAKEVAAFFSVSNRSASALCNQWLEQGFLMLGNSSKKARSYQLAEKFERIVAEAGGPAT